MNTRPLGRTGLEVSELGFGGLFVASAYSPGFDIAEQAVAAAYDAGINYVDTAPGYGNSEEVLGQAFAKHGQPAVLSTKLGGRPKPFEPRNADHLRSSVDESLRLLGRDVIDLLLIHEPDRPGQFDWWTDHEAVQGPVLDVLDELKRQGKIRFTGLGGTTVTQMTHIVRTGRFDVLLTAFNYSLLFREAENQLIPAAVEQRMGIIVGSPLQQGVFAQRHDEAVRRGARWLARPRQEQLLELYALCDELDMPLPELAMRFVISNPHVATVLTGSKSPEELRLNVEAIERGPLPADVLRRLDEIAALVPFRPCEEPFGLPLGRGYGGPGVAR